MMIVMGGGGGRGSVKCRKQFLGLADSLCARFITLRPSSYQRV